MLAPADVPLSERTVVEPDLFVVRRRDDGMLPRTFAESGQLLLAVEVLSPSTARADRFTKRAAYLANGVPDYWIVDTANRLVERWRPGDDEPDVIVGSLAWQPMPDAPPLFIDLESYFRSVLGE